MRFLLLTYCLVFCCLSSSAQQYLFKNYGLDHGLPQSELPSPQAGLVDSRGRIWVATNGGGLALLEQKSYRVFREQDGLNSNLLMGLVEAPNGDLWILSQNKNISQYNGKTFISYPELNGKLRLGGTIAIDNYENVWVLAFGAGAGVNNTLYWKPKDKKEFEIFLQADSLTKPSTTLFLSHHQNFEPTLVQNGKSYFFNGKRFVEKVYPLDSLTRNKNIILSHKDFEKNEWLTLTDPLTGIQELVFFDTKTKKYQKIDLPKPFVWNLATGWLVRYFTDNRLYAMNPNINLILIFENKKFVKSYTPQNGFNGQMGGSGVLMQDSLGSVWVGTRGSGIVKLPDGKFTNFTPQDGLQGKIIFGIHQDKKGRIWLGSSSAGVTLYEEGKLTTVIPDAQNLIVGRISHFYQKEDTLLAATGGGIIQITEDTLRNQFTWKFVHQRFNLPAAFFRNIVETDNLLWFCSQANSVYGYDLQKDSLVYHFADKEFKSSAVIDVKKDSQGNYWFATFNGVVKWNGETFQIFNTDKEKKNFILQLYIDARDVVWAIAYNDGLVRIEGSKVKSYQTTEGLSADIVYGILPVKNTLDQYWITTQRGLDKVYFRSDGKLLKTEHYNKENGYFGDESNGKAIFRDRQDRIWVGHLNGVTVCDFDAVKSVKLPTTFISEVNFQLETTNWKDSTLVGYYDSLSLWNCLPVNLKLPSDKNSISFTFYSEDFSNPKEVQYQWQLEGLHEEWLSPTTRAEASFSNLSAGKYTFKVRTRTGKNSQWGDISSFSFAVRPKWWQLIWVQIGGGFLLLGLIYGSVKWRVRSLEASRKQLAALVKERTQEVVKQKDEILEKNQELLAQQQKLSEAYADIQEKNANITASITYAKRIQEAMLPSKERFERILPNSFVFYRPRDIVSGDFYWLSEVEGKIIIAAVDCTGHGVPGAFMSVIGSNLLYEIIEGQRILEPAKILDALNESVRRHLNQDQTQNRDGMDMALCVIDKKAKKLHFAGAKNPLVYIQNGQFHIIKGDRFPIGGFELNNKQGHFKQHSIDMKDSIFYLYSDGYQDQFGGLEGRKYMSRRFQQLLKRIAEFSLDEQLRILSKEFDDWQQSGNERQIDDVLVIGFKL